MTNGYGRNSARAIGGPLSGEFHGLFEGVVVSDRDPEKRGRVQVRVYDIHDEDFPEDQLPWATPNMPSAFVHKDDINRNGGFFQVPPKDSLVNLMFRRGDPGFPVWMGGWFPYEPAIAGREDYDSHERRKALYNADGQPSCPTWGTLRGHRIELDDDAAEIRITTPNGHKITLSDGGENEHGDCIKLEDHKGNFIWMDTGHGTLKIYWDGDVQEHITGSVDRTIDGDVVEKIGGGYSRQVGSDVNDKITGQQNVDAATIWLNSGKAVADDPAPVDKGTEAGKDGIARVLDRLGNIIKKIVTGD